MTIKSWKHKRRFDPSPVPKLTPEQEATLDQRLEELDRALRREPPQPVSERELEAIASRTVSVLYGRRARKR